VGKIKICTGSLSSIPFIHKKREGLRRYFTVLITTCVKGNAQRPTALFVAYALYAPCLLITAISITLKENVISTQHLPLVIAGPIVRKVTSNLCYIWVVTSSDDAPSLTLSHDEAPIDGDRQSETICVGTHAFIHLLSFSASKPFDDSARVSYQLHFDNE
jgi:hypothetical protein